MAENIYEHIASNKVRTIILVVLFPVVLMALIAGMLFGYGLFMDANPQAQNHYYAMLNSFLPQLLGAILIFGSLWLLMSYIFGAKLILKSARAVNVMNFESGKEIHRIVENIAITAGLPCPEIYIIDDESLNAFATGRNPERASITLTTGIVKVLNKQELEAVIAHEMSHIGNRDIRLMLLMVAGIGFCTFMGNLLLRGSFYSGRGRGNNKAGGIILMIGGAFILFGIIIAPLLRLAVSRRREYQADATACILTRNPLAMASALRKIDKDSRVEVLDSQQSVSAMCIANPLKKTKSIFGALSGITATHPPISERISRLEAMGR